MAKKQKKTVAIPEEFGMAENTFDTSEFKKISLCLGILSLRLTHHKFKTDKDRIPFLANLGFNRHETAAILNTTPLSVSVVLTNKKNKSKRKKNDNVENQPTVA